MTSYLHLSAVRAGEGRRSRAARGSARSGRRGGARGPSRTSTSACASRTEQRHYVDPLSLLPPLPGAPGRACLPPRPGPVARGGTRASRAAPARAPARHPVPGRLVRPSPGSRRLADVPPRGGAVTPVRPRAGGAPTMARRRARRPVLLVPARRERRQCLGWRRPGPVRPGLGDRHARPEAAASSSRSATAGGGAQPRVRITGPAPAEPRPPCTHPHRRDPSVAAAGAEDAEEIVRPQKLREVGDERDTLVDRERRPVLARDRLECVVGCDVQRAGAVSTSVTRYAEPPGRSTPSTGVKRSRVRVDAVKPCLPPRFRAVPRAAWN